MKMTDWRSYIAKLHIEMGIVYLKFDAFKIIQNKLPLHVNVMNDYNIHVREIESTVICQNNSCWSNL
jgi:hypothetical protein